jgi:hypothetical protein
LHLFPERIQEVKFIIVKWNLKWKVYYQKSLLWIFMAWFILLSALPNGAEVSHLHNMIRKIYNMVFQNYQITPTRSTEMLK